MIENDMTLYDEALPGRSKQTGLPQVPMEPIGRHRDLQPSQLQILQRISKLLAFLVSQTFSLQLDQRSD